MLISPRANYGRHFADDDISNGVAGGKGGLHTLRGLFEGGVRGRVSDLPSRVCATTAQPVFSTDWIAFFIRISQPGSTQHHSVKFPSRSSQARSIGM